jgi:hypothetical protein
MATRYPIFSEQGSGQRIAINPDNVISIVENAPGRVTIYLALGGAVNLDMGLESVIALLTGAGIGYSGAASPAMRATSG